MYLRPGIVILKFIHSFILSHGVLFLLVSSAIDVATAVGWCSIECPYMQWVQHMEHTHCGLRQDAVRAMVTADEVSVHAMGTAHGTHALWVASRRRTCNGYSRWNSCVEMPYVRWL
jgi:hypothetical protein